MRELKIKSTNTYYPHLDQLVEHGYLTVEQQKNCGRFSVCIYRLNDVVESGPFPVRPRRGKKGTSEKLRHHENSVRISVPEDSGEPEEPTSEKVLPGGKLLETPMGASEKPISETC